MQFDVTILAVNQYDLSSILQEESFIAKYLFEETDGSISLESGRLDSVANINLLIKYLFQDPPEYDTLYEDGVKKIFNLTSFKSKIKTLDDLEIFYPLWIAESKRENNMDEYGMLLGFISYVQKHKNKKTLLMIVDSV